ncbi:MAG: hypothetical protein IJK67_05190 [Bacilli bacterium]|nr:hypothetical protein [Bacilli bacterium]
MKVICDGKEIEIDTELEEGERELDMLTPDDIKENDNLSDTVELTTEELQQIKENMENQ